MVGFLWLNWGSIRPDFRIWPNANRGLNTFCHVLKLSLYSEKKTHGYAWAYQDSNFVKMRFFLKLWTIFGFEQRKTLSLWFENI